MIIRVLHNKYRRKPRDDTRYGTKCFTPALNSSGPNPAPTKNIRNDAVLARASVRGAATAGRLHPAAPLRTRFVGAYEAEGFGFLKGAVIKGLSDSVNELYGAVLAVSQDLARG